MKRTLIKSLLQEAKQDQSAYICGWVKSKRQSKNFAFLVINDGSSQKDFQLIVDEGVPAFAMLEKCQTGAAIGAQGVIKKSQGKEQAWEMKVDQLKVFGEAPVETYPLQKKGHSLEFLREIGHLRPRTNTFGAVFRVRNELAMAIHNFFQSRGFYWAHTPILTANDCEGAGEMFQVTTLDLKNPPKSPKGDIDFTKDFFGKPAHLTVSGQLNGEAMAMAMGNIYTFGPTFRAENSNTTRHLSEFWMIEPEMAFYELKDNMILAEEFLKEVFSEVVRRCPNEIAFFAEHYEGFTAEALTGLATKPFAKISYTDAVKELEKSKADFQFPVKWGIDLQTEHERYLTEKIFNSPVIVFDYPKDIKAYYMKQNPDGKTVAAMDVLAPKIGEIIGGSQREDDYEKLLARVKQVGIKPEELQWYLDLRKFGGAPHAGFGLGFERLIQYVTGMSNIRDVIPFPRAPQTIAF
ncbi:MAG: asparagine--tRNA ligase [Oligoflexales bacterium]